MRKSLYIILSSFAVMSGLLLLMIAVKSKKNRIMNFLSGLAFTVIGLAFIYLIVTNTVTFPEG